MALRQLVRQEKLPFNQESYEVNIDFNDKIAQSYIDAIEHKDTKTFTDFDNL